MKHRKIRLLITSPTNSIFSILRQANDVEKNVFFVTGKNRFLYPFLVSLHWTLFFFY